jgi:hypothetical protein
VTECGGSLACELTGLPPGILTVGVAVLVLLGLVSQAGRRK